jgi:hypothetical protein
MKTLTNIYPPSYDHGVFAIAHHPKLVAQWQRGLEVTGRNAQWKLHLTLAHSPSSAFATLNHCQQP